MLLSKFVIRNGKREPGPLTSVNDLQPEACDRLTKQQKG